MKFNAITGRPNVIISRGSFSTLGGLSACFISLDIKINLRVPTLAATLLLTYYDNNYGK